MSEDTAVGWRPFTTGKLDELWAPVCPSRRFLQAGA
jgi:hypothetical protein